MPLLDDLLIPLETYEKIFKAGYRGTFLGGCIERKEGSNIRRSAHCHCDTKRSGKYHGYICIKSAKPEKCVKNGKLTNLFKHELAHLLSAPQGSYGRAFCKALVELAGRLMKHEHKTVRDNIKKVRLQIKNGDIK